LAESKIKTLKLVLTIFSIVIATILIVWIFSHSQDKNNPSRSSESAVSDSMVSEPTTPASVEEKVYWRVSNFIDNSNDETNNQYIIFHTEGVFSDSNTSESELIVEVLFTKTASGIFLHKYDPSSSPLAFKEGAKIDLKNQFGGTLNFYITYIWNQEGGLRVSGTACKKFRDYLEQSFGEVKVVIENNNSSRFMFKINTTGFAQAYHELK
jgi:ABC-type antimicrobial peptide transport system permease subunit